MPEKCELEVEYEVDAQEVIEDIDDLVDTHFGAHEEIGVEDDDNIVIQEEVVTHNDNNSSNEYEEHDIEFEEENEANDGDVEEPNEDSDDNDVMSI